METHFKFSDEQFEKQFKTCTLNPERYSHVAHIRLAWIHIKNDGIEKAVENICTQLLAFVDLPGAGDKYNQTVTVAAVRAVNHFMGRTGTDNLQDFIEKFPRLKYNFKELIASHYQINVHRSKKAKKEYLKPDFLPY